MICERCKQPIEDGQLYHYVMRRDQAADDTNVHALIGNLPVHDQCPLDFDPKWTMYGPGTFETAEPDLSVELWHPDPEDPTKTALVPPTVTVWNGRAFPGRCDHQDDNGTQCDNQATSAAGWWDGGGPGLGTWHHQARCAQHLES